MPARRSCQAANAWRDQPEPKQEAQQQQELAPVRRALPAPAAAAPGGCRGRRRGIRQPAVPAWAQAGGPWPARVRRCAKVPPAAWTKPAASGLSRHATLNALSRGMHVTCCAQLCLWLFAACAMRCARVDALLSSVRSVGPETHALVRPLGRWHACAGSGASGAAPASRVAATASSAKGCDGDSDGDVEMVKELSLDAVLAARREQARPAPLQCLAVLAAIKPTAHNSGFVSGKQRQRHEMKAGCAPLIKLHLLFIGLNAAHVLLCVLSGCACCPRRCARADIDLTDAPPSAADIAAANTSYRAGRAGGGRPGQGARAREQGGPAAPGAGALCPCWHMH